MEMVKAKIIVAAAAAALLCSCGTGFEWTKHKVDGHRTGVGVPMGENPDAALGRFDGQTYVAPNGSRHNGGAISAVAKELIAVQPGMARLKEVVAYAPEPMVKASPESNLSNFVVDNVLLDVAEMVAGSGRKVDVAIINFGGIRVDLPAGNVLLDDLVAMLPFSNYLCYVQVDGATLRSVFEYMAQKGVQCVSGARLVIKGKKLVSVQIGGEPLDDSRLYGLATIDFLLDGGDGYKLARNQKDFYLSKIKIGDAILADVRALTAAGKPLEWKTDGRIIIED